MIIEPRACAQAPNKPHPLMRVLSCLSEARSGKTCSRSGDNYCRCSTVGEDGIELDLQYWTQLPVRTCMFLSS